MFDLGAAFTGRQVLDTKANLTPRDDARIKRTGIDFSKPPNDRFFWEWTNQL